MEWSIRVEYHIFLIYQKLTVQDFNFQLFGFLKVSTLRFGGSPLLFITFYSNPSGRGVALSNVLSDILEIALTNLKYYFVLFIKRTVPEFRKKYRLNIPYL